MGIDIYPLECINLHQICFAYYVWLSLPGVSTGEKSAIYDCLAVICIMGSNCNLIVIEHMATDLCLIDSCVIY